MGFKVELTTDQFIKLFGDSEYLEGFSDDAIDHILNKGCEFQNQTDDPFSISWSTFFDDARELNAIEVTDEYSEYLDEIAYEVLEMAHSSLVGLDNDVYVQLEEREDVDHSELLIKLMPDFTTAENWEESISALIASHKDFISLDNGNYLILE